MTRHIRFGARVQARLVAIMAALAVAALVATGCGGSSKPSPSTGAAPAAAAPAGTSPTPASASGATTVNISNFKFLPASLSVATGTKVTFVNQDSAPHTATDHGGAFDSGTLNHGQSKTLVLSKPGTYAYYCVFHAFMTATVTVK